MSTADITLSVSVKMAPGPEHRQEPIAPDKSAENNNSEISNERDNIENSVIVVETLSNQSSNTECASTNTDINSDSTTQSVPTCITSDNKQEEPATLSTLNEGELRALLDEAITYKCPKDREGKSSLFKELLQEAEADETEEGCRIITNSRCLPGSNRRRHKRDSVSERLTHGGSLQNLAQPVTSEFDSSFAYLTSGSSYTYGGNRRKNKKYTGSSVSARQREGGSLPSNVNASHSLASLANLDLLFDKKGFCEERSTYDWTNKEKSKSLDKPSYNSTKKEEKEKDKKDTKKDLCETEVEIREKRGSKGKYGTNEMLESDNPPPEYKSDYMVIDLGDAEVGTISDRNVGSTLSGVQRPHALDTEDDEGIEMKIIEPRRPQYIPRTTFDIAQTPVDTTIDFSLREHSGKQDKSKISVNGTEVTGSLSFQTFNSVKCGIGGNSSNTSQGKVIPSLCSMMSASLQTQNITMGSRYTAHTTGSGEKKSLDENGNPVQYNGERKKPRRKHTQEPNVIVYSAENVEGHRNIDDIEILINFIENKESKSKKGKPGNPVRVKTSSGAKPRSREKDTKREQLPAKLQKSNSLEEISKTKLEDLTTEKSVSSSGASSISSQHGTINVALRRAKQRSTGDPAIDSRGDRRSWGTEEGQSIYCNDTGDDYASRRNSNKKINPEPEHETEFLVVTKKKKSKKQRRSSSGSRAQNLTTSGSYLQNSRGFSNEYRTPLSPELRRKSASSMPPSDKSDSSDSDSVHSLPVTSNTSKHNLSKIATSSGGTPQASYADIARMATINMTHNSVLNMSTIVPNMLNPSSWPSVPPKTPSEPDKIPQDYYPSLDELQHSDRKTRQHNFTHSNHILNLSFEKPLSPTLTKMKNSTERKKAEAQEEAINKNIQVIKYVQDIEKMRENLTQQEQKTVNFNNHNTTSNEVSITNTVSSKLGSAIINCNPDSDNNNSNCNNNNKETVVNIRCNNPRARRGGFTQNNQNVQNQVPYEDQHFKKVGYTLYDENTKKQNIENSNTHCENKNNLNAGSNDEVESQKTNVINNPKSVQEMQNIESDAKLTKNEKSTKTTKEPNINIKHETIKSGNAHSVNSKQEQQEDSKLKKTKQNSTSDKDQTQKTESQISNKQKVSRPAVILLDETSSDVTKNSELPTELRFGFEINEQLLLSEDSTTEETSSATSVFPSVVPPLINKPPSNFDRYPPIFDKHMRCDKFTPNFIQSPNTHVSQQPLHPVMVQRLPCMGYPPRFPPPTCLPPPPTPPPGIMEKYHHQPKEDFSMLYVAPEEDVNIQTYNHDKIVSFVGLAWDAVMREMPVTAGGRIQFYSGQ
ncbi:probable serine/threonine-protein kinase DDB_G0282963 isoform X4 [Apis cerana]|uniref:probable serine/threonine-protein kinase DDB_G0282963 isoform X4 n=1 Tax=Apis cerana TaxID=7461 RepID=UPI002B227264|nr:probable serine/threonine-protein kinase DDB_G0282963 isoform X4 [Apis cerana]